MGGKSRPSRIGLTWPESALAANLVSHLGWTRQQKTAPRGQWSCSAFSPFARDKSFESFCDKRVALVLQGGGSLAVIRRVFMRHWRPPNICVIGCVDFTQ
jgi:hypothetical protein